MTDDRQPASPVGTPWRKVRGTRAAGQIVNQVKDAFFAGLRPGDWLGTEADLAERFGVSRITIRDAVRTLEANGIVDVRVGARGGVRIADADPDRFTAALAVQLHLAGVTWQELLDARLAIEPATADLAAANAGTDDLTRLRGLLEASKTAIDDPVQFTELSLEFHIAIADAAGNRALRAAVLALRRVERAQYTPNTTKRRAQRVLAMHEHIFNGIAAGKTATARALMTDHLQMISWKDTPC